MKVISSDPSSVVPDIMEDDINSKVLVVYLKSRLNDGDDYIGYMTRIQDRVHPIGKQLHMNGGCNDISGACVSWYDDYSSVLDLMIRVWKSNICALDITMYVLESRQDVSDLFKIINIRNAGVLDRINSEVNLKFGIE